MDSLLTIAGRNVRQRRKALGLTQLDLAVRADIDRAYVSDIERGIQNISLTTLQKVADALDASPYDLLKPQASI